MIKQSTFIVEPKEVIPTNRKSFQTSSLDHKRQLRNAQDGHEQRVVDNTARLAQANEQLRCEIKERHYVEELFLKKRRYLYFR